MKVDDSEVDITPFVNKRVDFSQFFDPLDADYAAAVNKGLGQLREPMTLSGTWDDRPTCISCGQQFTPGPEGMAVAIENHSGRRLGPICPACGTALVSPDA